MNNSITEDTFLEDYLKTKKDSEELTKQHNSSIGENFIIRIEKQNELFYSKINPKNNTKLKNLLMDFGFEFRLNRKLLLSKSREEFKVIYESFFTEREIYFNNISKDL
jgi:hypothetical protein